MGIKDDDNVSFETLQQQGAAHGAPRHWSPEVAIALTHLKRRTEQRNSTGDRGAHCRSAAVQHLRTEDPCVRLVLQLLEHF
jgi:hypothetical protein